MNQRLIAVGQFLIPHQELAEPIKPGVGGFHDPAPVPGWAPWFALLPANPREIPMRGKDRLGWFPLIAPVGIQKGVLVRQGENQGIQDRLQLADIVPVGSGYDQRQRGATPVDQHMALAPIFFPGLSGWVRRPLGPGGP
jgi:hypothetical protein